MLRSSDNFRSENGFLETPGWNEWEFQSYKVAHYWRTRGFHSDIQSNLAARSDSTTHLKRLHKPLECKTEYLVREASGDAHNPPDRYYDSTGSGA